MTFTGLVSTGLICLCLAYSSTAGAQVVARVSEFPDGSEVPGLTSESDPIISADGRVVVFLGTGGILAKHLDTGVVQRLAASAASLGFSAIAFSGSLSADGRYLAFASRSETLVPGKSNRCPPTIINRAPGAQNPADIACADVFVWDLQTDQTVRILGPEGVQRSLEIAAPMISGDGRWVVYSRLSSPPQLLLHDRETGVTTIIGSTWDYFGSISHEGRRIAFVRNTQVGVESTKSVLVYDRVSGTTEVADRLPAIQELVGAIPSSSPIPRISGDGRFVIVQALAGSIFIRDLDWQRTWELKIRARDGSLPDKPALVKGLSHDGRFVVFESEGSHLVANDVLFGDAFVLDRVTGAIVRASIASDSSTPDGTSLDPSMSGDGTRVVFTSRATNLLPTRPTSATHNYLASLDLDGDGLSNLTEVRRASPPRQITRFRTRGADVDPEQARIRLRNPARASALVWLRLVDAAGRSSSHLVRVPPQETVVVPVTDIPDRPRERFMLQVESDQPVFPGLVQPR